MAIESKCWICGSTADSREHRVKKSTLKTVFKRPTQQKPHHLHTNHAKNQRIGGLDNARLKFTRTICAYCNNTRTQPSDTAWQTLFEFIYHRMPPVRIGSVVRANRVFPQNTRQEMLNIHLYFAKVLGCNIVDGGVNTDTSVLSNAILSGRHVSELYLQFGIVRDRPNIKSVGVSEILAEEDSNGECTALAQIHDFSRFSVNTLYVPDPARFRPKNGSWHPRDGTGRLVILDL